MVADFDEAVGDAVPADELVFSHGCDLNQGDVFVFDCPEEVEGADFVVGDDFLCVVDAAHGEGCGWDLCEVNDGVWVVFVDKML